MKRSLLKVTILILAALAAFYGYAAIFVVPEGRQVVVTQFGKPVGEPITEAGLHLKIPLIQELRYVDKRMLSWDGEPNQIRTGDNKFISVDTTARYRIINALTFIQTVQSESGALARLDTILDAATRDIISNYKLVEAVRNTNSILDEIEKRKELAKEDKSVEVEEELTGDIAPVSVGREQLSTMIAAQATERLKQFGIELVDVQLRRISYEKSVEQRVYERMISERERIAEKLRSLGKGEQAKIEGRLGRELQDIQSSAYRKSQAIIGKAEAEAIKIYAATVGRDPELYAFLRTLEAYEKTMKPGSKVILSTESEYLKLLGKK
jgi:modulator of FtsH protease HflC